MILLDGSRKACAWGNDRDAVAKGILGPKALPRVTRRDYVAELQRLALAAERALPPRPASRASSARRARRGCCAPGSRSSQAEQRLAGTDGLGPAGFTIDTMQEVFTGNRNLSAELARDTVVHACRARGGADLAEACEVLAAWDGRADIDSRGAVLWRETWSRLSSARRPVDAPFDPADPVSTPRGSTRPTKIIEALRGAVADLRAKGIALGVPLGDLQAEPRGSERIAIPGCTEGEGCFNIISTRRDEQGRYDPFTGSSFVMAAGFDARGPPARRVDPHLLAVGEPALAALRGPDAAVLPGAVAADAVHRAPDQGATRRTRRRWSPAAGERRRHARGHRARRRRRHDAPGRRRVRGHAVRRARAGGDLAAAARASPRSCWWPLWRPARARAPARATCVTAVAFGVALGDDELGDLRGDGPDPDRRRGDDRVRRPARAGGGALAPRAGPRLGGARRAPGSCCSPTRSAPRTSTPPGVGFALLAAAAWAAYIPLSARTGKLFPGGARPRDRDGGRRAARSRPPGSRRAAAALLEPGCSRAARSSRSPPR